MPQLLWSAGLVAPQRVHPKNSSDAKLRGVPCRAVEQKHTLHHYVTQQLQQNPRWPLDGAVDHSSSSSVLTDTTTFRNDFCRLEGREQITIAHNRWHARALRDLPDVQWTATSAAPCLDDANSIRFSRTIRWVPPSIQWLVVVAMRVPGWRPEYVEIWTQYDRVATFSWAKVWALFASAARTGALRIPVAAIPTTVRVTLRPAAANPTPSSNTMVQVVAIEECVDLVPLFESSKVVNRRVARDMLAYLDAHRPPGVSFDSWQTTVAERLAVHRVPGMGQFDIDGLEPEQRSLLLDDASIVLAFASVVVLVCGVGVGWVYLQSLAREAQLQALLVNDW